jgi:hypothetical protein
MISAQEAFASIERAIQGVRRDEDRLVAMLSSAQAEIERLRAAEADGYRALATLRLDALARDEVVGRLDSAERRAVGVLERRRGSLDAAAKRRAGVAEKLEATERRRDAAVDARDAAVAALEAKEHAVEAVVSQDPAWLAQKEKIAKAEATAASAEEKAKQAEADLAEKRVPFESDSLFVYLWRAKYGTSGYRAGPLTRFFDGKVAALIGFEIARRNFFMLNEIPLRLREHAARQAATIDAERAALEAIEREMLVAQGIEPLEKAADAAEAAVQAAEAEVAKGEAELAKADEETHVLLDGSTDPEVRSVLDELAAAYARDDLRSLYQEALKTPGTEDEKIVQKLQDIERDLVRATAQAEEVRKASIDLANKRVELERSRGTFRERGYQNPWGEFSSGVVIGSVIEGIIRGALSSRNLDDALGKEYRRRPRPRIGGGGSWGGGGGRSGGGFRTGGGSGGGGFRTGGGF